MQNSLIGKTALITGASRGIGKSIAELFVEHGSDVILAAKTPGPLIALADELNKAGSKAAAITIDLEDETSILEMMEKIKSDIGRLDIIINNAGITHSALLTDTTTADFDRVMKINARAPFIICREGLPLLEKSDQPVIINISSVVGVKGYAKQTAYSASKHALRGMSIAMAQELKDTGIRVHVICPGGVNTDMVTSVRPDIPTDELINPEEIAELALYLATHKGNGIVDEIRIRRATSDPWF